MRIIQHPSVEKIRFEEIMNAFSDPLRSCVVKQLSEVDSMTCTALTGNKPKSSMSHHFKVLRDSGVIQTTVVGKEHYNSLRKEDLKARFPGLLETLLLQIRDLDE